MPLSDDHRPAGVDASVSSCGGGGSFLVSRGGSFLASVEVRVPLELLEWWKAFQALQGTRMLVMT